MFVNRLKRENPKHCCKRLQQTPSVFITHLGRKAPPRAPTAVRGPVRRERAMDRYRLQPFSVLTFSLCRGGIRVNPPLGKIHTYVHTGPSPETSLTTRGALDRCAVCILCAPAKREFLGATRAARTTPHHTRARQFAPRKRTLDVSERWGRGSSGRASSRIADARPCSR